MCKIFFEKENFSNLNKYLERNFKDKKILVIVDEHTNKLCFPSLLPSTPMLGDAFIMEISSGESSKSLETCNSIWEHLISLDFNRNDLIVNLGGGVISDLGGFVASTFKRGMPFINIPTTVLAQVDAAIGGKTGVNYLHLKNLIGAIVQPKAIFISDVFINTLPLRQVYSGLAEIIKTALIYDYELWLDIVSINPLQLKDLPYITKTTAGIKEAIVKNDPNESGHRKILNFGHTIGHALETYSSRNGGDRLLHGEAVVMGMICEAFISYRLKKISKINLDQILEVFSRHFKSIDLDKNSFPSLLQIMKSDKKNIGDSYNFTLLEAIGDASFDNIVEEKMILDSLEYLYHLRF